MTVTSLRDAGSRRRCVALQPIHPRKQFGTRAAVARDSHGLQQDPSTLRRRLPGDQGIRSRFPVAQADFATPTHADSDGYFDTVHGVLYSAKALHDGHPLRGVASATLRTQPVRDGASRPPPPSLSTCSRRTVR